MFLGTYEKRLSEWRKFRDSLEDSADPLQDVINAYKSAPSVSINCDPWDKNTWMNPWELLENNEYCNYCIILGMCYTLQLTDKFNTSRFEIHIGIDRSTSNRWYLLFVNDRVLGYDHNTHIGFDELPSTIKSETSYSMPRLK
jgi:hypothetical protein